MLINRKNKQLIYQTELVTDMQIGKFVSSHFLK